jgi:TonB family protein
MKKILSALVTVTLAGCSTGHNVEQIPNKTNYSNSSGTVCKRAIYPLESMRAEEEGTTNIVFTIDVDGSVSGASIAKSSGYARLDDAAMQALMSCKYQPLLVNGVPQKSWTAQNFVWKLPAR